MKQFILICLLTNLVYATQFEISGYPNGYLMDIQFLKFFNSGKDVSLFNRTLIEEKDKNISHSNSSFLNYSIWNGLGVSYVYSVSNLEANYNFGLHGFITKKSQSLVWNSYLNIQQIKRHYHFLSHKYFGNKEKRIGPYLSSEFFSIWERGSHFFSVSRFRVGFRFDKWRIGIANNNNHAQQEFEITDSNFGAFFLYEF